MNHDYIEQFDLVDLYALGNLSEEQRAEFEEHFADCSECIGRIKTARHFIQDLKYLTIEQDVRDEGARVTAAPRPSSHPIWRFPLLAACVLGATVGAILIINYLRRLQSDVNGARVLSVEWEHRYEEQRQVAIDSESQRQQSEQALSARINYLEQAIGSQQRKPNRIPETGTVPMVAINVPIFQLASASRGASSPNPTVNTVSIPRFARMIVVSLALEGETKYKDYRVNVVKDNGQLILAKRGLTPDRYNSLTVGFGANFLRPGKYNITVQGLPKSGGWMLVGTYPLDINPAAK